MSCYRVVFRGDFPCDVITIKRMYLPHLTSRDFRFIKHKAYRLAMDITDGYCLATVYRDGKRCFLYTMILDEFPVAQMTQIWDAWPCGNYRTMRKVTFREEV